MYSSFFNVQSETWNSINVEGVETYFFFGNNNDEKIISNKIYLNINEGFQNCGYKTIRSFELTKDFDYDYIFRTNSSSFIDKKILFDYLNSKPRKSFYSGVIGIDNGIEFASGSGYVISKDLVNIVLENSSDWNHNFIDDVSLGLLLKSKGFYPISAPRYDIQSYNIFQSLFYKTPLNYFHYRLKSKNRSLDLLQMKRLFWLKKTLSLFNFIKNAISLKN